MLVVAHTVPRLLWEVPIHTISPMTLFWSLPYPQLPQGDHWPGLLSMKEWKITDI